MLLQSAVIPFALTSLSLFLLPVTATAIYYDPATARTTYPTVTLEFPGEEDPSLSSMKINLVHKDEYGIIASKREMPMVFEDLFKEYKASTGKNGLPPAIIQLTGVGHLDKYKPSSRERVVRIVDTPENALRTWCTYVDEKSSKFSSHATDREFSEHHFATEMEVVIASNAGEMHCSAFYINSEFNEGLKAFIGGPGGDAFEN